VRRSTGRWLVLAVVVLATGCSSPASPPGGGAGPAPSAAPTAASTAAPEAAADVPTLVACLQAQDLPRGATVKVEDSAQGATVNVDVRRPDLDKGRNRITVVRYADSAAAAKALPGTRSFVGANGGDATAVDRWIVAKPFGGDDDLQAVVRRCAGG
jgi:hypothetical protein